MIDRRTLIAAGGLLLLFPRMGFAVAREDRLRMRDLYNEDMSFSDLAQAMEGQRVAVKGFMAPPLRAETRFYVLTNDPKWTCPFCDDASAWPEDILAVYSKRFVKVMPVDLPIAAEGILRLGTYKDLETGFVSRVRLEDAEYSRV